MKQPGLLGIIQISKQNPRHSIPQIMIRKIRSKYNLFKRALVNQLINAVLSYIKSTGVQINIRIGVYQSDRLFNRLYSPA